MEHIKTSLSILFIALIIFVFGIVSGIKVEQEKTTQTIERYKSIYTNGQQYFCVIENER